MTSTERYAQMNGDSLKRVIIDGNFTTDMAQAVTLLSSSDQINLVAVTLVSGQVSMSLCVKNCSKVLAFLGCANTIIYKSETLKMGGESFITKSFFDSSCLDNLEIEKENSNVNINNEISSAEAIVKLATEFPKRIHLLCVGPLTNLALALYINNDLPNLLGSLTIRASDAPKPLIVKNSIPTFPFENGVEFNTWCDPEAFRIIMINFRDKGCRTTIIDRETCFNYLFPRSILNGLEKLSVEKRGENPYYQLLSQLLNPINLYSRKKIFPFGTYTPDLFAAFYVINPNIFQTKMAVFEEIHLDGDFKGHAFFREDLKGTYMFIANLNLNQYFDEIVNILTSKNILRNKNADLLN